MLESFSVTSNISLFVVLIKIERRYPIFRNILVKFNVNTNLNKCNLKTIWNSSISSRFMMDVCSKFNGGLWSMYVLSFVYIWVVVGDAIIKNGGFGILLTGLILPHFCACPKLVPEFPTSYTKCIMLFFMFNVLRWLLILLILVGLLTIIV